MLAKQIDHARKRIRELSKLKLEDAPSMPASITPDEVKRMIENEELLVTSRQLNKAFDRLIAGKSIQEIEIQTGTWDYQTRTTGPDKCRLTESKPTTIWAALRDTLFSNQLKSDAAAYTKAKKAYDAKVQQVKTKAAEVEDFIVLGDVHTALQALKEFEDFEV
jgi:hypothetical protein